MYYSIVLRFFLNVRLSRLNKDYLLDT